MGARGGGGRGLGSSDGFNAFFDAGGAGVDVVLGSDDGFHALFGAGDAGVEHGEACYEFFDRAVVFRGSAGVSLYACEKTLDRVGVSLDVGARRTWGVSRSRRDVGDVGDGHGLVDSRREAVREGPRRWRWRSFSAWWCRRRHRRFVLPRWGGRTFMGRW